MNGLEQPYGQYRCGHSTNEQSEAGGEAAFTDGTTPTTTSAGTVGSAGAGGVPARTTPSSVST
ncbi:hypothetical protein AB0L10_37530 [Streptomyces flaveolus]|uniref:hypothetical protein n=1 Tax=Streptomyces flaveolus TaxID=67297 RepID=UPI003445FB29